MGPLTRQAKKACTEKPKVGIDRRSKAPSPSRASPPLNLQLPAEDFIVTINVGGTIFRTVATTLLQSPSLFHNWIAEDFSGFPRDAKGVPFLDRDPTTFRHILNYFRGYGLPEDPECYPFLAEDAVYFNCTNLMKAMGVCPPVLRFLPGPGVSPDGLSFSTEQVLGLCGSEPLSFRERDHFIEFRYEKAEMVEVGVVAAHNVRHDAMLSGQERSISIRNTGVLMKKIGDDLINESAKPVARPETVIVSLHFARELEGGPGAGKDKPSGEGVGLVPASALPSSTAETNTAVIRAPTSSSTSSGTTTNTSGGAPGTSTEAADGSVFTPPPSPLPVAASGPGSGYAAFLTFQIGDTKTTTVWPAPVPPLYFAASIRGASSVIITSSSAPSRL